MTPVNNLLGVGAIPRDKTSARKWLERNEITVRREPCPGGERLVIDPAELPEPELQAYAAALSSKDGPAQGEWDSAAWASFLAAAPTRRADAERKAKIVRALQQLRDSGLKWADCHERLSVQFNGDMLSVPSLKRLLAALKGVDQINYAPALLTAHTGRTVEAEMSEAAWQFFLKTIHLAHQDFPIIQAWRDTRDVAQKQGWRWPAYETVNRRWKALPYTERLTARVGAKEAQKRLSQPVLRDKTSIHALEWVSMDGRVSDIFIQMPDGKLKRPVVIILEDIRTGKVIGWEIGLEEDAAATVRLIIGAVRRYGLFTNIQTDNGSSFTSKRVSGQQQRHFRKATISPPVGVCDILGINLTHNRPKLARAKSAERVFRTISRTLDDRPEFFGAHTGHRPGARADDASSTMSLDQFRAIFKREIERHNAEEGRRNQGANGRSYDRQFADLLADQVPRKATEQQLRHAGLVYEWRAVDRDGRIKINNWVYGDHSTFDSLIQHHEAKTKVLFGYDATDLGAPGVVYDRDGRLICTGIAHVERGAYDSAEGIKQSRKNEQAARKAVREADAAINRMTDQQFKQCLTQLGKTESDATPAEPEKSKVVAGHFASPLRGSKKPTSKPSSDPESLAVLQQFKTEGLKKRNEA